MNNVRNLGEFANQEALMTAYPAGGLAGDVAIVAGEQHVWDTTKREWVTANDDSDEPSAMPIPRTRPNVVFPGDVSVNNNLNVGGILRARVVRGRSAACGLFASVDELVRSVPRPFKGQWAMVEIENRTDENGNAVGEVYRCPKDGVWTDAGFAGTCDADINALMNEKDLREEGDRNLQEALNEFKPVVIRGNVTNAADEEDITSGADQLLKLKDKAFLPSMFSGLGRKMLRKNLVGSDNVLTQEMVAEANTIYIVQYDFTLDFELVTIPAGCILDFQGGSIKDGMLRGTDTIILRTRQLSDVLPNVTLFGTFKGNSDTDALMQAVGNCYTKEETYSKEEINNMNTTPNARYVNVASVSDLPDVGEPDTIFRVAGEDSFTEMAWNGTEYIELAEKNSPPVITDEQMDAALAD